MGLGSFLHGLIDRLRGRHRKSTAGLHATMASDLPGPRPGVGVCLSGGGSRAMTAGMGQLRGLAHLELDGEPLLAKVSSLSTVSGGSWIGVPYIHLPHGTSDQAYLNGYVDDPGRLVLTKTHGHSDAEVLDHLPKGNPGRHIVDDFSIPSLLERMLVAHFIHDTPWHMMWQVLIAQNLLRPYGLFHAGSQGLPTSLFSLDQTTLKRDVVDPNPTLKSTTAHLVASGPDRMKRPFMICNTALFVRDQDEAFEYLVPVQATSQFTGIVGATKGVDSNGRRPGGGGVTSFAFSSAPTAVDGDDVTVSQTRPWSLTDIVGASSAAFAETLQNLAEQAKADPNELHERINQNDAKIAGQLTESHHEHHRVRSEILKLSIGEVRSIIRGLDPQALIPKYDYWPVLDAAPDPDLKPTRFADAGSLENTGIAATLHYEQIHSIIAFVNAGSPLSVDDRGIVKVAGQIPVLFGFQPYDEDNGYVPYEGVATKDLTGPAEQRDNKVFEPSEFQTVLDGLRDATGSNLSEKPAMFCSTHTTVHNKLFGVRGGRTVTVVWYHLGPATAWSDQLSDAVASTIQEIDGFPNYSTADTELDALRVNAMANLTAWSVANPDNRDTIVDLFR